MILTELIEPGLLPGGFGVAQGGEECWVVMAQLEELF